MANQIGRFLARIGSRLLWGLVIFLTAVNVLAEPGSASSSSSAAPGKKSVPPVDRTDLFRMAYSSMSFLMQTAVTQASFRENLTPEEMNMFAGVSNLANLSASINWFKKNKVTAFRQGSLYVYAYAIEQNVVARIDLDNPDIYQLRFSDDQSLFDLDENKNVRSAKTYPSEQKDIFINTRRINDGAIEIDFAQAMSMMIHEVGHKLGNLKNQKAVNSMAAKFEQYIRSITSTEEINGLKVNTLMVKNFSGYDQWIQNVMGGPPRDPKVPKEVQALTVFDNQGVYLWTESTEKVTDLSDTLKADFKKSKIVEHAPDPHYQMLKHDIITPTGIRIEAGETPKTFVIRTNAILRRMVIAFMQPNSYDPAAYKLFEKVFYRKPNYSEALINYEQTYLAEGDSIHKVFSQEKPLEWDVPDVTGEILEKILVGDDLLLKMKIQGNLIIGANDPGEEKSPLWPQVTVSVDGHRWQVTAEKIEEGQIFTFRIKNALGLHGSAIQVRGLRLKVKSNFMVLQKGNMVGNALLAANVDLKLPGVTHPSPSVSTPQLQEVQIWNDNEWKKINDTGGLQGSYLRFIFKAQQPLRQMTMKQTFQVNATVHTPQAGPLPVPLVGSTLLERHWDLMFSENSLRQTQVGDLLYVDLNIDHDMITTYEFMDHLMEDPGNGRMRPSDYKVKYEMFVNSLRKLTDVSWVSSSGIKSSAANLTPLIFKKNSGSEMPDQFSAKLDPSHGKKSCESVFGL